MTIIEIRPFRNGWEVYENQGAQPVFLSQEQPIDYATRRACFRSGEKLAAFVQLEPAICAFGEYP